MMLTEIFDRAPIAKMKKLAGVTPEMLAKNADIVKTVLANRLTLGQTEQLAAKLDGSDNGDDDTEFQLNMLEKLAKSVFTDSKAVSITRRKGRIGNLNDGEFVLISRDLKKHTSKYFHYVSAKIGFVGKWTVDMRFEDKQSGMLNGVVVERRVRTTTPEEALDVFKKFYDTWEKRGWERK